MFGRSRASSRGRPLKQRSGTRPVVTKLVWCVNGEQSGSNLRVVHVLFSQSGRTYRNSGVVFLCILVVLVLCQLFPLGFSLSNRIIVTTMFKDIKYRFQPIVCFQPIVSVTFSILFIINHYTMLWIKTRVLPQCSPYA